MNQEIKLIDVGARGGIDARWNPYYEYLDVMGFEPDPDECAALNAKRFPYSIVFLPEALGARNDEKATLYICKSPGCSSLLKPNMNLCASYAYGEAMDVVGKHTVTLNRMDTVCKNFQPDVMKVDTQGTELDVLIGAGQLLDNVLAVELEVEFVPQYQDQPLFSDVDAFMRDQGFQLRGIRRTFWREKADHVHSFGGQLIHGDALYLRPERLDCPKGHIILAAYRQFDMLACFGAKHLIPKEPFLLGVASRVLSRFSNREMRRFVDRLCPPSSTDWHDPDFF